MSEKKVIFLTTSNRNNELGGQELFIRKLINILSSHNISYKVITPYSIGVENEIYISHKKTDFFKTTDIVKKEIKCEGSIILHSNDCYSNLIAYSATANNPKNLVISTIIHDVYVSENMALPLKLKKKIYLLIDKIVLKKFNYIIFYSNFLYENSGFKKSLLLPPGIETSDVAIKTKPSKKIKKIGWIGRPDIQKKGLDLFFHIINILNSLEKNYEYHIAGLNDKNILQKYYQGSRENIKWYGYINDKNLFWDSIDAIIVCSRYEGLGLVFLECVSRGIPVFATDIPSFKEIARSLDYPIQLFTPDKNGVFKICESLNNFDLSIFDAEKYAKKNAESYSFEQLEKKYLNFIQNVIY